MIRRSAVVAVALAALAAPASANPAAPSGAALGAIVKAEAAGAASARRIHYRTGEGTGELVSIVVPPDRVQVLLPESGLVRIGGEVWWQHRGRWLAGPSALTETIASYLAPLRADDWRADVQGAVALPDEKAEGRTERVYEYSVSRAGQSSRVRVWVDARSGLPSRYRREWTEGGAAHSESWSVEYDPSLRIDPPSAQAGGRVEPEPAFVGNYPPQKLPSLDWPSWPAEVGSQPAIVSSPGGEVRIGSRSTRGHESLRRAIAELIGGTPGAATLPLYVGADAHWSTLEPLLDALAASGASRIALVYRSKDDDLGAAPVRLGAAAGPVPAGRTPLVCQPIAGRQGWYSLNLSERDARDLAESLREILAARPVKDVDILPGAACPWEDVVRLADLVLNAGGHPVLDTTTARAKRMPPPPPPPPPPPHSSSS